MVHNGKIHKRISSWMKTMQSSGLPTFMEAAQVSALFCTSSTFSFLPLISLWNACSRKTSNCNWSALIPTSAASARISIHTLKWFVTKAIFRFVTCNFINHVKSNCNFATNSMFAPQQCVKFMPVAAISTTIKVKMLAAFESEPVPFKD